MKVRRRNKDTFDAVQWFPGTTVAGVEPFGDKDSRVEREMMSALPPFADPADYGWCPAGTSGCIVRPGDWILTAESGDRWPCNPRAFETTYEHVVGEKP
jgi:hypothetical protein